MLLVALEAGCSTTSTISRLRGPDVEGDIIGGSPDEIFVVNDNGRTFAIARDDISEIDYPGNVHAVVGGVVLGYGVLNIAAGMSECSKTSDNQAATCTGVFLPAAIGTAMMIWGIVVNQGQKSAAADTSTERADSSYPRGTSGHRAPTEAPEQPPPPPPPPPVGASAEPPPPPPASAAPAPSETTSPPPPAPPPAAPPPAPPPPKPTAAAPAPSPPPATAAAPAPSAPPPSKPSAPPSKGFPIEK